MEIVEISDVHLGHRRTDTNFILTNLDTWLEEHKEVVNNADLFILAGDLWDRGLSFYDASVRKTMRWFFTFVDLLEENEISLLLLNGTQSHDMNQMRPLVEILERSSLNFHYSDKVEVVNMCDHDILCVPDEASPNPKITEGLVIKALSDADITKADIGAMHGFFPYQLPDIVSSQGHDESFYHKHVEGPILIGHVHTYFPKDRILPAGSFDRLCHGEEEEKGGLHVTYKDGVVSHKRLINKHSKKYHTVNLPKKDNYEDIISFLEKKILPLEPGSYVSIKAPANHPAFNLLTLIKRHFQKVIISTNKQRKKQKPVEISAIKETVVERTNILEVYKERVSRLGLSDYSDVLIEHIDTS